MKLKDLCLFLDSAVPLSFQESYDNSGLQVGIPEREISSAIITLDVTEDVMNEAVNKKCDIIISHHPLIFTGIKKISGRTFTERILYKAIKHDIAIYSSHTNLDIFSNSVSRKMAEKLELRNIKVLSPLKNRLLKLVTYIPESHLENVRKALFEAGAGVVGNYDQCGFTTSGTGSFRGGAKSNPFVGEKGKIHFEKEIRFETILFSHIKEKVIKNLIDIHPYEEVAFDIYPLENDNHGLGLGCIGEFDDEIEETDFLKLVSAVFNAKGVRYSKPVGKPVKKVALCGGSGASLLNESISSDVDAFITSDIKYHNFFDADNKIILIDIGHFESEKYSSEILYDLIIKKFPKFAVRFSETNTNPINYL
ncbi:MAG TPA: Nif3-like dinuclear metal center hexameric protein [Bacteroidales bacterium]|nr:Nif3-like dinuclear metal center hexameric protein [Bacteroidales bacterium]